MSKKLLLFNYYWPPCGGSAVQRWLDITNVLVQQGFDVHVITIDPQVATFPFIDNSLLERVHPNIHVHTTDTNELFNIYNKISGKSKKENSSQSPSNTATNPNNIKDKIARFVRGNFFIPDPRRGWNTHAIKKAIQVIQEVNIDIICTAGPPSSSHLIGLEIKKEFPSIYWLADFHDYWTDNFNLHTFYRTQIAQYFDRKLEKKVLETADEIITHCQSSKTLLRNRIQYHKDKIQVLTMGYNPSLIPPIAAPTSSTFNIAYTGILADNYDASILIEALSILISQYPDIPLKIQFAGSISEQFINRIHELKLTNYWDYKGYISQKEAIDLLHQASILVLINPNVDKDSRIVPGKIYEYLAMHKPILSISSKGSENEVIINDMHAGQNFQRDNVQSIVNYLDKWYQYWLQHRHTNLPYNTDVQKYSRDNEARKLGKRLSIL